MPTWPTCGESGQITLAKWGVPNARREDKKTAKATWPTCGQSGYIIPNVLGIPKT